MHQQKEACQHLDNITRAEGENKMPFEVRLLFARSHFSHASLTARHAQDESRKAFETCLTNVKILEGELSAAY
jgi:hypothetical protein